MTDETSPRAELDALAGALKAAARIWPDIDEGLGALTCTEAESMAAVLAAGGYPGDADDLLWGHALYGPDDAGDMHHDLLHERDPERFGTAEECGCQDHDPSDDLVDYWKEQPDA